MDEAYKIFSKAGGFILISASYTLNNTYLYVQKEYNQYTNNILSN